MFVAYRVHRTKTGSNKARHLNHEITACVIKTHVEAMHRYPKQSAAEVQFHLAKLLTGHFLTAGIYTRWISMLPAAVVLLLSAMICSSHSMAASAPASRAVILQYHHVSDQGPASTRVSPRQFVAHLDYLDQHGYQVWPLDRIITALKSGQAIPDKVVAITFDDASASIYANAFPALKKHRFPFTLFLNSEPVDKAYSNTLSWQQINEMQRYGMLIGNHSYSHPHMIRRVKNWRKMIGDELEYNRQRIKSETGADTYLFAYPYGEADEELRELLTELGYTAFGQHSGPIDRYSDFSFLPRFPASGIYASLDSLAEKLASWPMPLRSQKSRTRFRVPGALAYDSGRPELEFCLRAGENYRRSELRCYPSGGGGVTINALPDDCFSVRSDKDISTGRSRYSCTMPRANGPGYYWFSQPWIRLAPNDSWYED